MERVVDGWMVGVKVDGGESGRRVDGGVRGGMWMVRRVWMDGGSGGWIIGVEG